MARLTKQDTWDIVKAVGGLALIGIAALWPTRPVDPEAQAEEQERDRKYKRLSGKVLRRARFRCESCGLRKELKVHYIVDPDEGGECTYDNLQALCDLCRDKSLYS